MNRKERKYLHNLLQAEISNYETAKDMATPQREIDKGDLLARSWGRITLINDLLRGKMVSQEKMEQ